MYERDRYIPRLTIIIVIINILIFLYTDLSFEYGVEIVLQGFHGMRRCGRGNGTG